MTTQDDYDADALLSELLDAVDVLPPRWAGTQYAFGALINQHTLGSPKREGDLIAFIAAAFENTEEQMRRLRRVINKIETARGAHLRAMAMIFEGVEKRKAKRAPRPRQAVA
ncbi:MAG: hypothetical protein WDM94_09750 [Bauldia sp.]